MACKKKNLKKGQVQLLGGVQSKAKLLLLSLRKCIAFLMGNVWEVASHAKYKNNVGIFTDLSK